MDTHFKIHELIWNFDLSISSFNQWFWKNFNFYN